MTILRSFSKICFAAELMQGPFNGSKSLDISDNVFIDEEKLLSLWIHHDMSLRHLNISCLDNKYTVPSILDVIVGMLAIFVQSMKLFILAVQHSTLLKKVFFHCFDAVAWATVRDSN